MNLLHKAAAAIEHEPIEDEFKNLELLNDTEFQRARAVHLASRRMPSHSDNAGVTFVLALIGVPVCLVLGLVNRDSAYVACAVFWLVVGIALFIYLALAARYWREHYAIIAEELRRYGRASFG
jgi:hypothetical protein